MIAIRTCRVCGCTDIAACPGGCWWVGKDLCSRCAEASGDDAGKGDILLEAAEQLAVDYQFHQVILLAWDGRLTHVATFGQTVEDSAQAAEGGNRIKRALGWPERMCQSESRKVAALRERIAELEADLAAPRSTGGDAHA